MGNVLTWMVTSGMRFKYLTLSMVRREFGRMTRMNAGNHFGVCYSDSCDDSAELESIASVQNQRDLRDNKQI